MMPETKIQVVLPARLASTRLSEKLLQMVAGRSVLEHTYRSASRAQCARHGVVVAVDHPRMANLVESFGGRWIMTPEDCPSGTDRIAIVAKAMPEVDVFVNVQSDEPEIDPAAIDAVADLLARHPESDMATAGTPIRNPEHIRDPGIVKIVLGDSSPTDASAAGQAQSEDVLADGQSRAAEKNRAIYFSRAPIPFCREGHWDTTPSNNTPAYWHHLGLYAYRSDFLSWFASAPVGTLESIEKLEQLRAIESGKTILVAPVGPAKPGIDTAQDLEAFRQRMEQR